MARISQETIDRVRNAADILEIVSQYVDLKQRGRNYFGLCPFHHEKTPSFSVAPDKEIYHCFGCGAGGSAINFIMEYEKVEFAEAVRKLGQRYGIAVQTDSGSEDQRTRLYQIHDFAQKVFHDQLWSTAGKPAREYILARGLSEETLREFGVGYARDSYDHLFTLVKKEGFKPREINASGLFSTTEKGTFDRFHQRVMFPIYDTAGKIIAFGGRTLSKSEPAKYLNSPETTLYRKSDVFYGLHASRAKIRTDGLAILVEGYTDFLRLYQEGLQNVVAVSGTSLTERHVRQLRRFAPVVIVLYDGDSAGISAAVRAGYLLLQGGIAPKLLAPPDGLDPDDWVKQSGIRQVQLDLKKAEPLIKFQVRNSGVLKQSVQARSRFLDEALLQLVAVKDTMVRTDTMHQLSELLSMEEKDVVGRFQGLLRRSRKVTSAKPAEKERTRIQFETRAQKAQLELIRILAGSDTAIRDQAKDKILIEWFTDPTLNKLARILLPIYEKELPYGAILTQFEDPGERQAVSEIFASLGSNPFAGRILQDCIKKLQLEPHLDAIRRLRLEIRQAELAGKDATDLAIEVATLQQEIQRLKHE